MSIPRVAGTETKAVGQRPGSPLGHQRVPEAGVRDGAQRMSPEDEPREGSMRKGSREEIFLFAQSKELHTPWLGSTANVSRHMLEVYIYGPWRGKCGSFPSGV